MRFAAIDSTVTELLAFALITIGSVALIHYHWKRRRLYYFASKLTGPVSLPLVGSAHLFAGSMETIFNTLMEICETYPLPMKFWLGNELYFVIGDPHRIQIVFNEPKSFDKSGLVRVLKPVLGNGLFTVPGEKWKTNRKIISQAFNQRTLNSYVAAIDEHAVIFGRKLEKYAGTGAFDVYGLVGKCVLDGVCETTMGIKVNSQAEDCEFIKLLDKLLDVSMKRMFKLWYQIDALFYNTPLGKEYKNNLKAYVGFTKQVVTEKRTLYKKNKELTAQTEEGNAKIKSLLELLIEFTENERFTDEELREEVSTFLVGGVDTTTTALSNTLIMLGMHPEIQQKVYDEVIEVVGTDRPIDEANLPHLKYTERVLMETLRLLPLGSIYVRYNRGDVDVGDGLVFPAGSSTIICPYHVHRSPQHWPDPLKFDPDRFLPEEVAKRHPYAFLSFSGGPRHCIGKKYAMMMMKCILANTVRKYRLATPYKRFEDIKLEQNLTIKLKDGSMVAFELRD